MKDIIISFVSRDVLEKESLQMFVTEDIHFCCLSNWEIIPFCRTKTYETLRFICPMYNPTSSFLFVIYLLLPLGLNSIVIVYINFVKHSLRGKPFFFACIWGAVVSIVMMMFHFMIEDTTKNQTIQFHFKDANAAICQFLAIFTYVSSLFYPCIIICHWTEIYVVMKFVMDKDKHVRKWHCMVYYLLTMAIIIGSGFKLVENRRANTVCDIHLTSFGKLALVCGLGLLYLCIIVLMVAVQRQIKHTRKASGREKGKREQAFQMKIIWMTVVVLLAYTLHVLQEMNFIKNQVVHQSFLYIQQTLLPIAFPVMFAVSTRHFKETMKGIARKIYVFG
jgi:hypothetical protein